LPFALYVRNDNRTPRLVKLVAMCGPPRRGRPTARHHGNDAGRGLTSPKKIAPRFYAGHFHFVGDERCPQTPPPEAWPLDTKLLLHNADIPITMLLMGPTIICDKSSLQALSKDELSVLRTFYSLNLPPILLMEILGDLKKHFDAEESRKEVEMLANKILPACSSINADFRYMIRGELAGHKVEMAGRPVLIGARQIANPEGKRGFIFEEPTEHKALLRWQRRDFDGADLLLAEAWRLSSQSIDLERMQRKLKSTYSGTINLKNLSETASFVDELLRTAAPHQLLVWFLGDASIGLRGDEPEKLEAIRGALPGSISSLMPYTAYCLRGALIFHFGIAFGLVSTRATNRLDLEYFYYAPFCHVFTSGDNFHRKMASMIAPEQMFVPGSILKADLLELSRQRAATESGDNEGTSRRRLPAGVIKHELSFRRSEIAVG
jgi:hypothetical protein